MQASLGSRFEVLLCGWHLLLFLPAKRQRATMWQQYETSTHAAKENKHTSSGNDGRRGRRYAHMGYVTGCEKKEHARLDSKSLRVEHTQDE